MKEFIEKLIGRLEGRKEKVLPKENYIFGNIGLASTEGFNRGIKTAISIVNQLAEEYKQNTDQDLMIVESLPSLYPLQPFEVEALDRVVNSAKHSGGWIPVAEHLPKEDMWCLATFESGGIDKIQYLVTNKWGWNGEFMDNRVIAWQPLPDPYIPKQEEQKG